MNDDARVAEIVGYTFYLAYQTDNITPSRNICWPPDNSRLDKTDSLYKYELLEIEDIDFDINFGSNNPLHPFISAPTFATDGIVLEWVQGQRNSFQEKFNREMKRLANKAFLKLERYGHGFESGFELLVTQKPGMYAQALLEVNDNE